MSQEIPRRLEPGPRAVATYGVVKRFGADTAVDGLDLEVPRGSVYVLVGPNGAGKTTTLRILLDLLRPDEGEAEVMGLRTDERPHRIRAQVGYVPERQSFHYGWIRVRDLVEFHAGYYPAWDHAYARALMDDLGVPAEKKYAHLSKGLARRVQLVLALAHRPPLLVLDEPTDGLDPVGKQRVLGLVADHLASAPTTVLVSTHLVYEAERLGDHLGVLKDGRLTAQLPRDRLEEGMRRYLVGVPEGWDARRELELTVLGARDAGRERALTVWGDEREVRRALEEAGATVREVSRLSLEEAALALLEREDETEGRVR